MYRCVLNLLLVASIATSLVSVSWAESTGTLGAVADEPRSIESVLSKNAIDNIPKKLMPFGNNLFNGAFRERQADVLNPNYIITFGDKISVKIWGATAFDDVLTVDLQGNIFIPTFGPITVGGVPNSHLNSVVTQSVRKVFKESVNVYTSLNTTQPVTVYVTGTVVSPGRYGGVPSSSILYFLDNADGIDAIRGSYRNVNVIRNNEVIETVDLYEFLMEGKMQSLQFKDGDTIFVSSKGRGIAVEGDVRNNNQFELREREYFGSDIVSMSIPSTEVTHASVLGFRDGRRIARYMSLEDFLAFQVDNGDRITFKSDIAEGMIVVEVEGEFDGQSQYVLPKNTRILELLDYIKIDPKESAYSAISIKRQSIAARQKTALHESLNRIESAYFTASSHTNEEAKIRAQESQMISEFIKRARTVEPNGRLVLAGKTGIHNVRLEMGDVINIPRNKESVMVNGEVLVSQAILWEKSADFEDYIARSGGFSKQADIDSVLLLKQSGEVVKARDYKVLPGDEIVVLPKVPVKSLQLASTIADIVYKIAVAARVAIAL